MKLQKGTDTAFVFKISPFISGIFLFAYCSIIFGISSFSRPTEDLNLPTGTWPHLIEYAGLGLLAYVFFAVRAKRAFLFAVLFSVLYAASDELHQYFVPGRTCEFWDFFMDTCGIFVSCLFMSFLEKKKLIKIESLKSQT